MEKLPGWDALDPDHQDQVVALAQQVRDDGTHAPLTITQTTQANISVRVPVVAAYPALCDDPVWQAFNTRPARGMRREGQVAGREPSRAERKRNGSPSVTRHHGPPRMMNQPALCR